MLFNTFQGKGAKLISLIFEDFLLLLYDIIKLNILEFKLLFEQKKHFEEDTINIVKINC